MVTGCPAFLASEFLQDGVVRSFEVIGEVVKRFDPALVARYPNIGLSDFAASRPDDIS